MSFNRPVVKTLEVEKIVPNVIATRFLCDDYLASGQRFRIHDGDMDIAVLHTTAGACCGFNILQNIPMKVLKDPVGLFEFLNGCQYQDNYDCDRFTPSYWEHGDRPSFRFTEVFYLTGVHYENTYTKFFKYPQVERVYTYQSKSEPSHLTGMYKLSCQITKV